MALRVIVVGSGIVGTCVAVRLAARGAEVVLLDAGVPGEGTTGCTFAWIDASHPSLAPYVELNIGGLAAWRRLGGELGDPSWLALSGTLTWETDDAAADELEQRIGRLRELGHACVELSPSQARALEPDLLIDRGTELIAHFPTEGYVFTRPALADLMAQGRRLGVEMRAHERVVELRVRGARVKGVTVSSGQPLDADVVVTCVGRWTEELLAWVEVEVPMISPEPTGSPAVGLLVLTTPLLTRLRRVLFADGLMVRPDGAGRLLLHADEQDLRVGAHTPVCPAPPEAQELLDLAAEHLRHTGGASVQSAQIGIRALPVDRLPVVGPALEGLYVIATHSGVTLAPTLAELVAGELIDERTSDALARFRPARFETAIT